MTTSYFIRNKAGNTIAIYENGSKECLPLLLIHGNSLGAYTFKSQFESPLLKKYRVISLDLAGHGNSENASGKFSEYKIDGFVETIVSVLEELKIKDVVMAGHSFGGHLLLQGYERIRNYAKGYVLFGTPPMNIPPAFDKMFFPHPAAAFIFKKELDEEQAKTLAASFCKKDAALNDSIVQSILRTDPLVRESLGSDIVSGNYRNEIAAISSLKFPVALFHGEGDQLVNPLYFDSISIPSLWKSKIHIIPDSGHTPQMENPSAFNKLLDDFCDGL